MKFSVEEILAITNLYGSFPDIKEEIIDYRTLQPGDRYVYKAFDGFTICELPCGCKPDKLKRLIVAPKSKTYTFVTDGIPRPPKKGEWFAPIFQDGERSIAPRQAFCDFQEHEFRIIFERRENN